MGEQRTTPPAAGVAQALPRSPRDGRAWRAECSRALHRLEPCLAATDCDDLSASLWQLDLDLATDPQEAAARFMSEHRELLLAASPT